MSHVRKDIRYLKSWIEDWNRFCRDVLKVRLDSEQQSIISSVQHNPMTAVASGTARGKDFVAACAAMCFMYLTPRWKDGKLSKNTKIAMTAPTARQVYNIMMPEISRLFRNAEFLPGRLLSAGIRTNYEEWFLTGFKAGDDNTEAWSGFHAVNTMFVVTEASGISEATYNAIEGNLQGNSRLLIVFNPNITTGYAARAMKSNRFAKFRLNSLNAENVVKRKLVIPGQVDYEWVKETSEPILHDLDGVKPSSCKRFQLSFAISIHSYGISTSSETSYIDTIGEGAGVYSRLEELGYRNVYSCKYSESAKGLHDLTGQYEFANMRAYCYWSLRDWLNPKNGFGAAIPPCDKLSNENCNY